MKTNLAWSVLFGVVITTLAVTLCLVLIRAWSPPADSIAGHEAYSVLALQLSFGQTFASFASLFLTGAFGFFAFREFIHGLEFPSLEVVLLPGPRQEISVNATGAAPNAAYELTLGILNKGKANAESYAVDVSLPFLAEWVASIGASNLASRAIRASSSAPTQPDACVHTLAGAPESWGMNWDGTTGVATLTFRSQNTDVYGKGGTTDICHIVVPADKVSKKDYRHPCRYSVSPDKGPRKSSLVLVVFKS